MPLRFLRLPNFPGNIGCNLKELVVHKVLDTILAIGVLSSIPDFLQNIGLLDIFAQHGESMVP